MKPQFLVVFLLAGLVLAPSAMAEEKAPAPTKPEPAKPEEVKPAPPVVTTPFYGNTVCPVSGEPTVHDSFVTVGNERIYLCCNRCKKKAKEDTAKFLSLAYPADAVTDFGNALCPVKGGKVKADVSTVWQGHRVHFCCPGCEEKFLAAPNKLLSKLADPSLVELGNTHCIVETDEEVVPDLFLMYDHQIIGLCCTNCIADFGENPKGLLAAYTDAQKLGAKKEEAKPADKDDDKGGAGDDDDDDDDEGGGKDDDR